MTGGPGPSQSGSVCSNRPTKAISGFTWESSYGPGNSAGIDME